MKQKRLPQPIALKGLLIATVLLAGPISGFLNAQPVLVTDSLALVDLFNDTEGNDWKNKTGWLTNPVKQWTGVTLSSDGTRVTSVSLANNGLEGTIPESIGNLNHLEVLDLSYNALSGSIPAAIGNLVNLKYLRLTSNQLTGPIPGSLGSCTGLINLYLPGNKLSGNIPAEIGNLTSLTQLKLFMNQLSGEVPPCIINMSALQIIELNTNLLEGSFPPFPNTVTKLDISNNRLTGIPDMAENLPALKILYIQANTLSFNEITKVYLLGITTINYFSQWRFPVEMVKMGDELNLTMKYAGKVKTYYTWYRNGVQVFTGADSTCRITQAEVGDRFWAEAKSNQIYYTTLTSDTITITEPVTPVKKYVINSNADKPLSATAPDGMCTTGDSIMIDGVLVPECTFRAAIEMVNKIESATRTEFTFNMQQGPVMLPLTPLPEISYPIGLDGSNQPGGLVFLKGSGVENNSENPSTGIHLKNTDNNFIIRISVEEFGKGIVLEESDHIDILDCQFLNNTMAAIDTYKSNNLNLRDNFVKDQQVGFRIIISEKTDIQGNTIKTYSDLSKEAGGILMAMVSDSRINNNEISMSRESYHKFSGGIILSSSESVVIDSNHIHSCPGGITAFLCKRIEINDNHLVNNERSIIVMNYQPYDSTYSHNSILRNVIGIGPDGTPGTFDKYGIYLEESNRDIILGNQIANQKEYGIYGIKVFNGYFRGNTIGSETSVTEGNGKGGIQLGNVFFTTIADNVISGNGGHGVDCLEGYSIAIIDNYIGTGKGLNSVIGNSGNGILLAKAVNPVIRNNQIHGNTGSGLVIEDGHGKCIVEYNHLGKQGFDSFGNTKKGVNIKANNITLFGNYVLDHAASHGIYLERNQNFASDLVQVYSNEIMNNQFGMLLKDFTKGQVTANTIMYNYSSGLTILGKESSLIIDLNNISENGGGTGIHLNDASATIRNNSIKGDETDGIAIEGNGQILIEGNNIAGNTLNGVRNAGSSTADARGNWWGDISGPGGQGPGNGDAVSSNVLFNPWKTSPAGVSIAASADTMILRPEVTDSLMIFFNNWIEPEDELEVTVTDSLEWSGSYSNSFVVNLRGVESQYHAIKVTPDGADIGKVNKIKVTARSKSETGNADSLVCYLKTEPSRLVSLLILPGFAEINPEDTIKFSALSIDQFYNITPAEVNWEAEGGSISADGLFIAGETPGTYNIIARNSITGITDTAFVTILLASGINDAFTPQPDPGDILIYPNPSRGMVNIRFRTNQYGDALIIIHSLNGTLAKALRTKGLPPAIHEIGIDLLSLQEGNLPDGVYLVSVVAGHTRKTGRLILIR